MSDPAKPTDPREARLAAALRDNLKRRKAQARARAGTRAGAKTGSAAETGTEGHPTGLPPEAGDLPQSGGE